MIKKFYHYTTIENRSAILRDGKLYPSYYSQTDTAYGEGFYLTDLHPDFASQEQLYTLWGSRVPSKTRSVIIVEIDEKYVQYCRDNVYILPKEVIPNGVLNLNIEYTEDIQYYGQKRVVIKFAGWKDRKLPQPPTPKKISSSPDLAQILGGIALGILGGIVVGGIASAIIKK